MRKRFFSIIETMVPDTIKTHSPTSFGITV